MKEPNISSLSVIGCDEVGVSEMLRPQVFCACFVSYDKIDKLKEMGVRDSKTISRKKCCRIAKELINIIPYYCSVLTNKKYNRLCTIYDSQVDIECIYHNAAIKKIINELKQNHLIYEKIIMDKFCEKNHFTNINNNPEYINDMKFIVHGEQKHIAVAAASIIATYYQQLLEDKINEEVGFCLCENSANYSNEYARLNALTEKCGRAAILDYAKVNHAATAKYFILKAKS